MNERYARDIISHFPYPIASPYARLRTDECLDAGPMRLKYILATGEAIARFCGILVLCECRATLEGRSDPSPPEILARDLPVRLRTPSWGGWLQITRDGLNWLHSQEIDALGNDLRDFMLDARGRPSDSFRALERLLEIRNDLSHHKRNARHVHEFQQLCEQSFAALEQVLAGLAFLMDYELAFVSVIHVHKRRRHDATFHHNFKVFGGESDTDRGDRVTLPRYCESEAIIFKNLESGAYINLDPFLIYEEQMGRAVDLFFFNGMKRCEHVEYSACKHGGSFSSGDSPQGARIAEEVTSLLDLFSPGGEVARV